MRLFRYASRRSLPGLLYHPTQQVCLRAEIIVHGAAQDHVAQIMKCGRLMIYGDVGQTFMYAAKGEEVFVLGNAAGRPLINAVGRPRVVINGTCLDYLAESFMAGDPLNGAGSSW